MSRALTLDYPESLPDSLHLTPSEFEQEAKLAMAAKLYENGPAFLHPGRGTGRCAKVVFLHELGRLGVSPIQTEADELARDLAHAGQASLVTDASPLIALAAALDDLGVVGKVATLVVPGEVLAELRFGAGRDATAR